MKIVIVEGDGLRLRIRQAEHAEVADQIAFFLIILHLREPPFWE